MLLLLSKHLFNKSKCPLVLFLFYNVNWSWLSCSSFLFFPALDFLLQPMAFPTILCATHSLTHERHVGGAKENPTLDLVH